MKAEERRELKTNELAEWIFTLPQQIKENLQMVIYASIIIIAVIAVAVYYLYQKDTASTRGQILLTGTINMLLQAKSQIVQAQSQGVDISYNLIQTADELDASAQKAKTSQMAALALIKRGEALRTELHYRPGGASRETLAAQMNLAKASYNRAVEKAEDNPSLMSMAKFGLGLCEEELGNFTEAQKIYHEIVADKNLEGTVAAAQAKYRLEIMADYETPITFKPEPLPEPAAAPVIPPVPGANIPMMLPAAEKKPAEANQGQK